MAQLVVGNEGALASLYDRYGPVVFGAAFRMLGDRQLAEEVMQETFLALWNRAELYDPTIGSLSTWLLTIARNRAVDRHRARSRRPPAIPISSVVGDADPEGQALERVAANGALVGVGELAQDPELAADRAWLRAAVREVLATMPELDRRAIELAYYEELTQSEIAERLGWPLGTVKTRTRRALARLRVLLGERLGPELGRRVAPVAPSGRSAKETAASAPSTAEASSSSAGPASAPTGSWAGPPPNGAARSRSRPPVEGAPAPGSLWAGDAWHTQPPDPDRPPSDAPRGPSDGPR